MNFLVIQKGKEM